MPESSSSVLLYNSLSKGKEPLEEQLIGLYVCGVTPYDTTHLGHAFTYVVFDVLVRYLRFLGREVTYVRNVTDIDDDILLRAHAREMGWKELGDGEYAKFLDDMKRLNNLPPEVEPRATAHMPEIVGIVNELLAKGLAYERSGHVYFDTRQGERFRKMSGLDYPAQLEVSNERGNFPGDAHKNDPLDFVLWQAKKEGEPSWPSPWGEGRPGWHIECSAMSTKYLGESFAIHGGGEDLLFPHHEAEIAQSEGVTGEPFVHFWMHTAMVYCGEHKMSKSLGNMVFIRDLLNHYSSDAIRLYLLSHHYREMWNYEERELDEAAILARDVARSLQGTEAASSAEVQHFGEPLLSALADDLNTPLALEELRKLTTSADPAKKRSACSLGERVLGLRLAS